MKIRFVVLALALVAFYPTFSYFWGAGLFSPRKSMVATGSFGGPQYLQSEQPHLSLAEALAQSPRIAEARGVSIAAVERVILYHTGLPTLSLLGKKTVVIADVNAGLDVL